MASQGAAFPESAAVDGVQDFLPGKNSFLAPVLERLAGGSEQAALKEAGTDLGSPATVILSSRPYPLMVLAGILDER
jgi:hypothetical protein